MSNSVLCSTGTFVTRRNNRNHMLVVDTEPLLHADGLEFMIYESWYDNLKSITYDLCDAGVHVVTVHADKDLGERISLSDPVALPRFTKNCEAAAALGARLMVLHLWNGVTSDSKFETNLAMLPELVEIAADYDVLLTVENVIATTHDPMSNLAEIHSRYPDVKFTFDTKMAAFHRQLELLYTPDYAWLFDEGCIAHVHISDYAGGYMDFGDLRCLHVGRGNIDFDTFFAYLREKKYSGAITLEASSSNVDGSVDTDALNASLECIRRYVE